MDNNEQPGVQYYRSTYYRELGGIEVGLITIKSWSPVQNVSGPTVSTVESVLKQTNIWNHFTGFKKRFSI